MLNRIVILLILLLAGLVQAAYAPDFTYVPPQQVAYWAPPQGFGEIATWSAPPEFQWPTVEAWTPPKGFVAPTEPWGPPAGWGEPPKWAPPSDFR